MVSNSKRDKNDIFSFFILKTVFKNTYFQRTVQVLVLALFLYAIYYGFEHPSKENIFTKNIFWGLFWSFFMVITLSTFGRIFCGICPHGFIGKYISKFGLNLDMPKFLKNRYIGIVLLVVGWWCTYYMFPGVLKIPYATALLFTALTILAILFFFLFKDMSYCKYICPIGNLTKAYQKVSFTKLGTYIDNCRDCKTFDCAKACTYNLKPFTFDKKNSMEDCSLCMDCANTCASVNFKIIPPASTLYKKTKIEKSDIWVYVLIFAAITFTMSFHHNLGRTNIAESLPWTILGEYVTSITQIKYIDFIGLFAYLFSMILVVSVSIGGMYLAARIMKEDFTKVFYSLGYSYAPLFLIAGLAHLMHSFFTKTYANIANGFIQGFSLEADKISNLATRGDSWLMIFNIFPYLAIILSFVILYKRMNLFKVKKTKKVLALFCSSSLILLYLSLNIYKFYVASEYGFKKRGGYGSHSSHMKDLKRTN